ncbi:MAG TPA: toll/interleukin-1 receptor domain-containing protein [Verrucomicrobiales bacterium]|nr:toll/interleukin-1 receptor domain-containing protein [Verrucomicrobiales bacterium]
MSETFTHDVFLSHSAKDKAVVRPLAERLRKDGLKVWFDEWEIKPGDSIPAKIEEGLEHSRVLVLCVSVSALGLNWTVLEAEAFRFCDLLNKGCRFIFQTSMTSPTTLSWRDVFLAVGCRNLN